MISVAQRAVGAASVLSEIKEFLKRTKSPKYSGFIHQHQKQLATWSVPLSVCTAETLHGVWLERYNQVLVEVYGGERRVTHAKFDIIFWSNIMAEVNNRRRLVMTLRNDYTELLTTASNGVKQQAKRDITAAAEGDEYDTGAAAEGEGCGTAAAEGDGYDTGAAAEGDRRNTAAAKGDRSDTAIPTPIPTGYCDTATQLDEQEDGKLSFLFSIAEKKSKGQMTTSDKAALSKTIVSPVRSTRDMMNNHAINLLQKEHLTLTEIEIIKLLLSGIINTLDRSIYEAMQCMFTEQRFRAITRSVAFSPEKYSLDLTDIGLINELIDDCNDVDSLLLTIQSKKMELIRRKERKSDAYKILCIMDLVAEYLDKPLDKKSSEITVYRRFATLLDFLFGDSDVTMKDGEGISEATRLAMGQSDHETSLWAGRKIDLLLKMKDTTWELASNEWKTYSTENLQLPQQSKNLRSNCAIINRLHASSHGQITSIMAADVVGTTGNIYLLTLTKDVYIPTLIDAVFLPSEFCELKLFKKTLHALFVWKNFVSDLITNVKTSLTSRSLENIVHNPSSISYIPTPMLFFTPRNNRKRTIDHIDQ